MKADVNELIFTRFKEALGLMSIETSMMSEFASALLLERSASDLMRIMINAQHWEEVAIIIELLAIRHYAGKQTEITDDQLRPEYWSIPGLTVFNQKSTDVFHPDFAAGALLGWLRSYNFLRRYFPECYSSRNYIEMELTRLNADLHDFMDHFYRRNQSRMEMMINWKDYRRSIGIEATSLSCGKWAIDSLVLQDLLRAYAGRSKIAPSLVLFFEALTMALFERITWQGRAALLSIDGPG